jgi:hypothetical protein
MKRSMSHTSRTLAVGVSAVAISLAGAGLVSAHGSGSGYGSHHRLTNRYGVARQVVSSGGEKFLRAGQTVRLGRVGHFTFSATCMKDENGENVATFDVTADTTAGLDGNAPAVAGTTVSIHTNSDALDGKDPASSTRSAAPATRR